MAVLLLNYLQVLTTATCNEYISVCGLPAGFCPEDEQGAEPGGSGQGEPGHGQGPGEPGHGALAAPHAWGHAGNCGLNIQTYMHGNMQATVV